MAENFLLPLILGISILNFIVTATVVLSPNDEEIRAEADLMQRIARARQARSAALSAALRLAALRPAAPWPAALSLRFNLGCLPLSRLPILSGVSP